MDKEIHLMMHVSMLSVVLVWVVSYKTVSTERTVAGHGTGLQGEDDLEI